MLINLLYVSAYFPFSKIRSGGGQAHYYSVKRFSADRRFSVSVVGFAESEELPKLNLDQERYGGYPVLFPRSPWDTALLKWWRLKLRSPWLPRYGDAIPEHQARLLLARLRELHAHGYRPDVVELEWGQIIILIDEIKRLFPNALFIGMEQDVLAQWAQRRLEAAPPSQKLNWKRRGQLISGIELAALRKLDLVLTLSTKDAEMIGQMGIPQERIRVVVPPYQVVDAGRFDPTKKDLVFFGAMWRIENWQACLWFLEEVMPLIWRQQPDLRFVVVGDRPPEALTKLASDRFVVTGFVEDVGVWFREALALVAPLKLGAGVKIKVLEGMTSGKPVVTGPVGIEGIPAVPDVHYLHAESPSEFLDAVTALRSGRVDGAKMAAAAQHLLSTSLNPAESCQQLQDAVFEMASARENQR